MIALAVGLSIWIWPRVSDLDTYRPRILALLTQATQRPVTLGHIEARLFPQPGLIARDVTLFYRDDPHRPFITAARVAMRFHGAPLWKGQLVPRIISFEQPRLFLTRDTTSWMDLWTQQMPARSTGTAAHHSNSGFPIEKIEVIDGVLTLQDRVTVPERTQRVEALNGSFEPVHRRGEFRALVPAWGSPARVELRVDEDAPYPIDLSIFGVRLRNFEAYFPAAKEWLSGVVTGRAKIQNAHAFEFQVQHLALAHFPGMTFKAAGSVQGERLSTEFQVLGTSAPMHGEFHSLLRKDPLDMNGSVSDYSPEIAPLLTDIPWITRLQGRGHAQFVLRRSKQEHVMDWRVDGGDFGFSSTTLHVQHLQVLGTDKRLSVDVALKTLNGTANVHWAKRLKAPSFTLNVTASSITAREVYPVFGRPLEIAESTGTFRVNAWQTLTLSQVRLSADITPHRSFAIHKARFNIEEAACRCSGILGLQGAGAPAHFQGHADHVPLEPFLARFFTTPPSMTGTAGFNFDFDFPLIGTWVEGLDGTLAVHAENGVIRSFKTLYDVLAVLNLINYLKLHLPKFHDEGIPYDALTGHFTVDNGIFTSKDIFLKTQNSNVSAEGVLDFPAQEIDATLRVQFFRLIEEFLRTIPGINWMLRDQHKILLPMVVKVRGPWRRVEVK
jgi:hypothetical protein